ncbi:MAG: hypothetical protein MI724_04875 [Spirochaetales bacterium]|nr:hypothetical protein [Spirochaetales bacterium]
MPNERRILLIILATVIVGAAGFVAVPIIRSERAVLEERITRHETQLIELSSGAAAEPLDADEIAALRERYERLSSRFYRTDEIDPYSFASEVSRRIVEHGMTIERSQPLPGESGGSVEFVLRGRPSHLLAFLSSISEHGRFWSVPFVAVTTDGAPTRARIRLQVGYETISDDER